MSATSVGEIGLDLVVNQNQFKKQMSGITSLAKKAGAALGAAFAVKSIVDFGKQCLELGSDLQEVQNVVDVTFPHMTAQVDKFAKSAAQSFGLSETMAKRYTGTFGAMAKAFGFTESQAYEMSTTLTGLAGDVASFYNLTQDEAYTKLKSVFTGETETLKDLGVVMTQSALDAYALANGYGKTTAAMTEMEKVALRYAFVQQQLSAAQGDFARTSDSWANQTRVMSLQLQSIMATIGQGLINLFTPVIKIVNTVLGKIATLANAFKAFTELITGKKSGGGNSVAAPVSELASAADTASSGLTGTTGAADSLADSTKGVGSAAKKAAKEMKALMGFDQIQKLDSQTDTGSDTGSSGSGGGGAGGSLGSAVDFGGLAEGETVIDEVDSKFTKMFQNLLKFLEPTTNAFKKLWNEGLAKLGNFTWGALKDFYNGFLVPVGKWTFGTGLPTFINTLNDGLMSVDFDKIRKSLRGLWDALAPFAINVGEGLLWFWQNALVPLGTWVANEVVPRFLDTLSIAIGALNNIIDALKPLFQWFWDSVLTPIAQWAGGVFLSVWDGINSALQVFSDWCAANPEAIQNITIAIGSFFAAWKITKTVSGIVSFVKNIGGVVSVVTKLGGLISTVLNPWTLALAGIITVGVLVYKNWDTIKAKAIEIWGAIQDWFETTIGNIKEFFKGLWAGIQETFQNVGSWFKEKFDAARSNVESAFKTVGKWFGDRYTDVTNAFKNTGTWFKEKFENAYDFATGAFDKAKDFFGGVWDGITGAFGNITGWFKDKFSAAWQAVKDVFSSGGKVFEGIKDGILESLKGVINGLITGINNVIAVPFNAINSALDSLRNWSVTIGPWTLTQPFSWLPSIGTPQIPTLAQGGFVKPNTPQLAMIGDNRHQGEVVAPEDKLQEMALEAVKAAGGNGITRADLESVINAAVMRIIAALGNMGFYLDGEQLSKAMQSAAQSIDTRFNPVEVG